MNFNKNGKKTSCLKPITTNKLKKKKQIDKKSNQRDNYRFLKFI